HASDARHPRPGSSPPAATRQADLEAGAASGATAVADLAPHRARQLRRKEEAKTGTLGAGRKEWLEESLDEAAWYPRTRVRHLDERLAGRWLLDRNRNRATLIVERGN